MQTATQENPMLEKLQPGDLVTCIDATNDATLTLGQTYRIEASNANDRPAYPTTEYSVSLVGFVGAYSSKRFQRSMVPNRGH